MVGRPWYRVLYVQVLIAILLGILLGTVAPQTGAAMKPLGDAFVALIRMLIAPVIFCTVVHGIASIGDLKRVGRVGLKALFYFEVVSTAALAIGLLVGELVKPGAGFNVDVGALDPKSVASYVTAAKSDSVVAHFMAIIPSSFFDALAKGDLLQVLLVAILTGFALPRDHRHGRPIGLPRPAAARFNRCARRRPKHPRSDNRAAARGAGRRQLLVGVRSRAR